MIFIMSEFENFWIFSSKNFLNINIHRREKAIALLKCAFKIALRVAIDEDWHLASMIKQPERRKTTSAGYS